MTSLTEIMTSKPLFQNTFILRRPGVVIFADIIKIVTMFMKKKNYLKTQEAFLDIANFAHFW